VPLVRGFFFGCWQSSFLWRSRHPAHNIRGLLRVQWRFLLSLPDVSAMTSQTTHSNADQAELDKFSALASRWWDPESEFKPLHAINPLRLGWIISHTGDLAGKRVVDVGCGGGILSESLATSGARVTGIDLAERSLKIARLHGLESGVSVDYRAVSAEQLAQEEPGQFDVVTCMEMLEHVPDPASIVRACADMAKPGGWIFFST